MWTTVSYSTGGLWHAASPAGATGSEELHGSQMADFLLRCFEFYRTEWIALSEQSVPVINIQDPSCSSSSFIAQAHASAPLHPFSVSPSPFLVLNISAFYKQNITSAESEIISVSSGVYVRASHVAGRYQVQCRLPWITQKTSSANVNMQRGGGALDCGGSLFLWQGKA